MEYYSAVDQVRMDIVAAVMGALAGMAAALGWLVYQTVVQIDGSFAASFLSSNPATVIVSAILVCLEGLFLFAVIYVGYRMLAAMGR